MKIYEVNLLLFIKWSHIRYPLIKSSIFDTQKHGKDFDIEKEKRKSFSVLTVKALPELCIENSF